jgi:hypothetical protein
MTVLGPRCGIDPKNYISFVWCRFRRPSQNFRSLTCTQFCTHEFGAAVCGASDHMVPN